MVPSNMALSFPGRGEFVFRRAPLIGVLGQVRFPPIYALISESGVVGFQEALRLSYPLTGAEQGTGVAVLPQGLQIEQQAPVWRIRDESETWTVSIAVDFVALDTTRYSNFADFVDRFSQVLDAVDRTVHPGPSTRIGLRKVNDFEHPDVKEPQDWSGFLRPELLGLLTAKSVPTSVDFGLADFRYADEDGGTLAVRHGVLHERRDKYRLDLDYFSEPRHPVTKASPIIPLLHSYSDAITSFFTWVLTDALFDYLEPVPRSQDTAEKR